MNSRINLIALLGAAMALLGPTSASAYSSQPLSFCNKTSVQVGITVGYHSPGINDPADHSVLTGPFVSKGWFHVNPRECATFANPFGARYMFWFGFSTDGKGLNTNRSAVIGGDGSRPKYCVTNHFNSHANHMTPNFTYEIENESAAECVRAGGSTKDSLWVTPRLVDTWVDATVDFNGQ